MDPSNRNVLIIVFVCDGYFLNINYLSTRAHRTVVIKEKKESS